MREGLTKDELRDYARVRPWKSVAGIAWTWGWILAAFAAYFASPSIGIALLAIVIISAQQHALAVLMHEAAHRLLLKNKRWNDRLSDWLCAYPLLLDTAFYRKIHLPHHRHTWTDRDPDLELARAFPITRASFRRKILRDLSGRTGVKSIYGLTRLYAGLDPYGRTLEGRSFSNALATFLRARAGSIAVYALMLGVCTLLGHPEAFFLLWFLPGLTGLWLLLRLRSISEHGAVSDPRDLFRQTRTTHAAPLARFLLAPHHVNYHLEHHLYPFVPHYNLTRIHHTLKARGILDHAELAPSYRSVWDKASGARAPIDGPTRPTPAGDLR